MRRTIMVYKIPEVGTTQVGNLSISDLDVETKFSTLFPYIKGREDIEVILRYPDVLRKKQPIELCGFKTDIILRRAQSLEQILMDERQIDIKEGLYESFTADHPILTSFNPEVIWFAPETGISTLEKNMKQLLPTSSLGFDAKMAKEVAKKIVDLIVEKPRTYNFWKRLSQIEYENETLGSVLIEYCIQNGISSKAKWLSGITPLIDAKTPNSVAISHQVNIATATLVQSKYDFGDTVPAYLYTINLNSSMLMPDKWTPLLDDVIRSARVALENQELFDGVFLSIRNLNAISQSQGRVNVVLKLMKKIAEISKVETAPSFWSRLGLIGLAALDLGENYCSVPPNLNLDDVFQSPGGPPEKVYHFGRIMNLNMRERWYANQVQDSTKKHGRGLPPLKKYWDKNLPTNEELVKPARYRINFAKPYNIAAFNNLQDEWEEYITKGDTNPGREFLQSCEAPYNSWGLR